MASAVDAEAHRRTMRSRSVLKTGSGLVDSRALKERQEFRMTALSQDENFRLQLAATAHDEETPAMAMHRAKHVPLRKVPPPRFGHNPQRQTAWSTKPPPLPFLPHPSMERQIWSPSKTPPASSLRSPQSARLLKQYRAAQPGSRPHAPRCDPGAYRDLGLSLLYAGQTKEAVEQLEQAVQLSGNSVHRGCPAQLVADHACALHRSGKNLQALEKLGDLLTHSPTALELYGMRAQVLQTMGRHDAAARDWRTMATLTADPAQYRKAAGGMMRAHNDAAHTGGGGGGYARPQSQPLEVARAREIETPLRAARQEQQRPRPITVGQY